MENKAQQFLDRYREIEEWVLNNLKVVEMKDLETMPKYKNIRSNLSFCRYLRNLLSHHDWNKAGEDLIIVTERAVKQVNSLYYALNPVTLMRLAINRVNIFAPKPSDSVLETINVMSRNDYSYVPIVDNQIVTGVFSSKILLNYISSSRSLQLSDSLKFSDISEFVKIDTTENRKVDFISPDITVEDAALKFQKFGSNRKRLDLLLITENGSTTGRLLGMITPADIVGL